MKTGYKMKSRKFKKRGLTNESFLEFDNEFINGDFDLDELRLVCDLNLNAEQETPSLESFYEERFEHLAFNISA